MSFDRIALAALACTARRPRARRKSCCTRSDNFNGPRYSASSSVTDLARVGFNDRASSVTIRGGSWQLCSDAYFRGQCVTLSPGNYSSLGAMGINNQVSSLREIGWNSGGGGGGGGPAGGGFRGGSIVLYESPGHDRAGRTPLNQTIGQLRRHRLQRPRVVGDRHLRHVAALHRRRLRRARARFGPGRYHDLAGVTGRVSSARPIADRAAGAAAHRGGGGGGGGNWGGSARVVLYEGPEFPGRSYTVNQDVAEQPRRHRLQRSRVVDAHRARLLDVLHRRQLPGRLPHVRPRRLSDAVVAVQPISSGRRISNDYPYNAPPPVAATERTADHAGGHADRRRHRGPAPHPRADADPIAVVGLSAHWYRPSYFAAKYMQDHGYRVDPGESGVPGSARPALLSESRRGPRAASTSSTAFARPADIVPIARDAVAKGARCCGCSSASATRKPRRSRSPAASTS